MVAIDSFKRDSYLSILLIYLIKDDEPHISSKNNRLREKHCPLYKAFRKTSLNHTRAQHHYASLDEYMKENKVPQTFKTSIQPQVKQPDTYFILSWKKSLSDFGLKLIQIHINKWEGQIIFFRKEIHHTYSRPGGTTAPYVIKLEPEKTLSSFISRKKLDLNIDIA